MLYVETSVLVKKYQHEPGTEAVRELLGSEPVIVSSILTLAEVETTLGRLFREGTLPQAELDRRRQELHRDWRNVHVVELSERVIHGVGTLVTKLPLKAADAIHLASALLVFAQGEELLFCSADASLLRSASTEGLKTWSPLAP